jgi:dihydrofolate reductase
MNLNLIDELQLAAHPLLLGRGKPLFPGIKEQIKLTLVDTKVYSTGLVQLSYNQVGRSMP